jgi:hypothetical protein
VSEGGNFTFSGNTGDWNVNAGSGTQHVEVNNDPRAAALEQIDQLVAKLLAGLPSLPPASIGAAAGDASLVKNEAHASAPDPARLSEALDRLTAATGPVPEMTLLSRQLGDSVGRLMR